MLNRNGHFGNYKIYKTDTIIENDLFFIRIENGYANIQKTKTKEKLEDHYSNNLLGGQMKVTNKTKKLNKITVKYMPCIIFNTHGILPLVFPALFLLLRSLS